MNNMDSRDSQGCRFRMILTGRWTPGEIRISFKENANSSPADFLANAEKFWAQKIASNPLLYNGVISSLIKVQAASKRLELSLGETNYKHFLFANQLILQKSGNEYLQFAPSVLGVSAAVVTKDERLPVIWRSQTVGEYPQMWDVMGGHIEPRKHADSKGQPDPVAAIDDEVCEEIGVTSEDILSTTCIGLIENLETAKPELLFEVRLGLTQNEVAECMKNAAESHEYTDDLWLAASAKELSKFLASSRMQCTPSAEGCLTVFRDTLLAAPDPSTFENLQFSPKFGKS